MIGRRCLLFAATWAVLASAALPCPALADERPGVEFTALRVGLADCYKLGVWTQVELALRADRALEGRVEIVAPDGDGVPVRYSTPAERPVHLVAGETIPVRLYARFGRPTAALVARFYHDADLVATHTFPGGPAAAEHRTVPPAMDLDEQLLLGVGPGGLGLNEALPQAESALARFRVAELSDVTRLPDRWYGYEGVRSIVLSTSNPDLLRGLDAARLEAIDTWIAQGGRLLLTAGPEAQRMLAAGTPLARFVPGRLEGVVGLRQTEALETYSASTAPVPRAVGRDDLLVARLAGTQGVIEAREADLPLVVRAPRSFGQVMFFAGAVDQTPLARWKGRPSLLRHLLDLPGDEEQSAVVRPMMHYGFVDIAGQLRGALDHFPGVRVASFSLVAVLVTLYIVLIGPLDYFLLRRFGRMMFTWVTFPATVLLTGVVACALAYEFKGSTVHTHQVDLLEIDTVAGVGRGTSWAAVFSPRPEVYDLGFGARLPGVRAPQKLSTLVGWLGMPGRGLGGMAPQASVPAVWPREYQAATDLAWLSEVPVPQWATKAFTARYQGPAKIDLQAALASENQLIEGSLRNTLGVDLVGCVLVHGHWAYDLGDLPAGQVARLGPTAKRSELRTYLTGRRLVFDDTKSRYEEEVTPYDLAGTDVRRILQTMMFFEAAGGSRYTGLVDNAQSFIDASDLLKTGRAMLVGFAAPASVDRVAVPLLSDGRPLAAPGDPHLVAVRIVLPVKTE
jgi:hypothetical protein